MGNTNGGVWVHNPANPCTPVVQVGGGEIPGPQVRAADRIAEQDRFLGSGPYSNIHPRTGDLSPERTVVQTGPNTWRSIREGAHEINSTNPHYHEEHWWYDEGNDIMYYLNIIRRVR